MSSNAPLLKNQVSTSSQPEKPTTDLPPQTASPISWQQAAAHAGCGLLVGGADAVPGVSGGTIALLLGIYARLVQALSRVDGTLFGHLRNGQWKQAAIYLDLPFLIPLGIGIGSGILLLGRVMHFLLEDDVCRPLTFAVMLGLILASAVELALTIKPKSALQVVGFVALGLLGAVFAWFLTGATGQAVESPAHLYLFLCGSIAICAMILPGISGAYLLVIMGVYFYITGILKALPEGNVTLDQFGRVVVFAMGAAIGLLTFTKVLKRLLAAAGDATLAVMVGFMIGALRKLWPFQEYEGDPKLGKLEYLSPLAVEPWIAIAAAVLFVVSIVAVVIVRQWLPKLEVN